MTDFPKTVFLKTSGKGSAFFKTLLAFFFVCVLPQPAMGQNGRRPPPPPPPGSREIDLNEKGFLPPPRDWILPELRDRALVISICARLLDAEGRETWASESSKVTIPGRPVGVKVLGENLACAVHFTPYLDKDGNSVLTAQGQIWFELPGGGIHYETILKTIPIEFGEFVYFFPLGSQKEDSHTIEICLNMNPYSKEPNFKSEKDVENHRRKGADFLQNE
ncbi:MAG: hypothetical protein LBC53_07130 [Spirochaetaceae bacterium]|nr:hypothetical protein [Spirochaetaceae bacterium]